MDAPLPISGESSFMPAGSTGRYYYDFACQVLRCCPLAGI